MKHALFFTGSKEFFYFLVCIVRRLYGHLLESKKEPFRKDFRSFSQIIRNFQETFPPLRNHKRNRHILFPMGRNVHKTHLPDAALLHHRSVTKQFIMHFAIVLQVEEIHIIVHCHFPVVRIVVHDSRRTVHILVL